MFFIYLAVFVLMVATPFMITESFWFFTEDETEAIVLLIAGIASFSIYRLTDYQVFKTLKDRIKLQRSVARAQKDLSESYSYIGQANRRTDIMYEIFSDLSHMETSNWSDAMLDAMLLLPYTNQFCLRFLDLKQCQSVHVIGGTKSFKHLPDNLFCKETNTRSYRHKDILFIYSESTEKNLRTCIALPYSEKAENDIEFFKAITAYFTMVYVFHEKTCV